MAQGRRVIDLGLFYERELERVHVDGLRESWFWSYDPAQARIEAESVRAIQERYQNAENMKGATQTVEDYRARALGIKEERADLVKHHLWVLWTDYFKAPHFEKYPQLNGLFNEATKLAGAGGTKGSLDVAVADNLIAKIDEIAEIFWETKKA